MLILTNFVVYSIAFMEGQNLLCHFCWCSLFFPIFFLYLNYLWLKPVEAFDAGLCVFLTHASHVFADQSSFLVVHDLRNFPGEIWNWPLCPEGRDRTERHTTPVREVAALTGKVHTQGFVLGSQKTNRSLHLLKNRKSLYRGLNGVPLCILSSQRQSTPLRLGPWKCLPLWEWGGRAYISRTGERVRGLQLPSPAMGQW